MSKPSCPMGRFAPSPSGRMHLGNLYTALLSWLSVKSRGGRWILRIEDLDPQRSKDEFARLIEDDLLWLGLEWDFGGLDDRGPAAPYSQSRRTGIYEEYFNRLKATGYTYPCYCTRSDLMSASAPHQSDGRVIYSGRCRPDNLPSVDYGEDTSRRHSTRLAVPDEEIRFNDLIAGPQSFNLSRDCGDFIIRRADGFFAYQLAVVVDDALMGVTEVMRGDDLLLSAAQQIYLYRLLDLPMPEFAHLPLLCNEAGQRLSKRDSSLSAAELRRHHSPQSLLGLIAFMARLIPDPEPMSLQQLLEIYRDRVAVSGLNHSTS